MSTMCSHQQLVGLFVCHEGKIDSILWRAARYAMLISHLSAGLHALRAQCVVASDYLQIAIRYRLQIA